MSYGFRAYNDANSVLLSSDTDTHFLKEVLVPVLVASSPVYQFTDIVYPSPSSPAHMSASTFGGMNDGGGSVVLEVRTTCQTMPLVFVKSPGVLITLIEARPGAGGYVFEYNVSPKAAYSAAGTKAYVFQRAADFQVSGGHGMQLKNAAGTTMFDSRIGKPLYLAEHYQFTQPGLVVNSTHFKHNGMTTGVIGTCPMNRCEPWSRPDPAGRLLYYYYYQSGGVIEVLCGPRWNLTAASTTLKLTNPSFAILPQAQSIGHRENTFRYFMNIWMQNMFGDWYISSWEDVRRREWCVYRGGVGIINGNLVSGWVPVGFGIGHTDAGGGVSFYGYYSGEGSGGDLPPFANSFQTLFNNGVLMIDTSLYD